MVNLFLVSIIWGFSFGLIKTNLTSVNPILVTGIRLLVACLVFIPFLKLRKIEVKIIFPLLAVGSLQFGLMYIFYNWSFQYLKAFEVALFTIFTPFYVVVINNLIEHKWNRIYLLTSILAIIGTGIIVHTGFDRSGMITGFFLVQLSNICFAIGQVLYRRLMRANAILKDAEIFAIPYLGGVITAAVVSVVLVDWSKIIISSTQWWNLLYLGALASGLGFFLWNYGARRTNIGALAIFNNLKIPLAILVSLIFFHEKTDLPSLLLGGLLILGSLLLNEGFEKRQAKTICIVTDQVISK
jgi:drug/metabolite transporter (DMT)-like permease